MAAAIRRDIAWLMLACLVTGAVRCVGLMEPSFWFDEAMSWRTSTLPWDAMIRSLSRNTHPPLFFAVLKLWIGVFGESAAALRSMNIVIAMLTPPFIWLFCVEAASVAGGLVGRNKCAQLERNPDTTPLPERRKALFRPTHSGLAACFLFAFSPFQIRLAWEARMYPLFVLLTVVSSWLLMRAVARPAATTRWIGLGTASLAMLYTHYFAIFAVAGECVFLAAWTFKKGHCSGKSKLLGCGIAAIIIASGWAFWLPIFFRQRQRVSDGWWTEALSFPNFLASATDLVASSRVLTNGVTEATCAAVLVLVVVALWRLGSFAGHYLAILIACGIGLPLLVSMVGTNVVVSRYFAATQVLWLIGVAALIASIHQTPLRRLAIGSVAVTFLLFHTWHLRSLDLWARPGMRAAVRFVESKLRDDEQIMVESTLLYFPALFYSTHRRQLRLLDEDSEASFFAGGPVLRVDERLQFKAIDPDCPRLWVISEHTTSAVPPLSDWEFGSCFFFPGTAP
ncbi:MAG: hypothetical protein ABI614_26605, partial [Planctomycetota bacterium]